MTIAVLAMRRAAIALAVVLSCTPVAAQSVTALVTELPQDFAHLISIDSAIAVGGAGLASWPLHHNDAAIARHLRLDDDEGGELFDAGNVIGDGAVQVAGALGVYALGWARHAPRVQRLGADLFRAQVVNGVMTRGIKLAVERTRPDGGSRSFPSGHASATFATATVLQNHFGWKAGIPAYALAAYVGSARLTSNHHFASDVAFGAGIGIAAGRATTFRVRQHRVAIAPSVGVDGVRVGVTVNAD
jgi:membrane-associated phospholipid phosphatase